jgi:nucleotide-binding universal stress UspA family protein
VLTTVLDANGKDGNKNGKKGGDKKEQSEEGGGSGEHLAEAARASADQPQDAQSLVLTRPAHHETLQRELARGYDIVFIGLERPIDPASRRFDERLQELVNAFEGPVAIAMNGAGAAGPVDVPLDILLPTSGTADSRLATEIALALAHASKGTVAALHVFDPQENTNVLRGRGRRPGISLLVDAHRLGKRAGVPVKGLTATNTRPEVEIRRLLRSARFDLAVLGTSLRQGETKFLGPRTSTLLGSIRTPALVIAR